MNRRPVFAPLLRAVLAGALALAAAGPAGGAGPPPRPPRPPPPPAGGLAAAGPTAVAAPVTVPDHRGRTLTLPDSPRRIVSLLPSLTEGVCALGGCSRLVGVDRFSNWPAAVAGLPKLGGLEDAQVERLVALKPDLVLAGPSARVIDRLEQLGLRVLVIESNTHADVRRGLVTLATVLGSPERAELAWAAIDGELRAAVRRVPPSVQGQRVFFEVDGSSYGAGRTSFIGETLARLGMDNIVGPELGPFPKLNPEFVVRARPDIVMAVDGSWEAMANRPGWSTLPAVQRRRGCGFAPDRYELLIRPGPRMGEAALAIADCLARLGPAR